MNPEGEKSKSGKIRQPCDTETLVMRTHPEATWTRPYKNTELDTSRFTSVGEVVAVHQDNDDVVVELVNAALRIRFISADIARITIGLAGCAVEKFHKDDLHLDANGPYGIIRYEWDAVPHTTSIDDDLIVVASDKLAIHINKKPFGLSVLNSDGKVLLKTLKDGIMLNDADGPLQTLTQFVLRPEDHFWGFGGRIAQVDRRGSTADLFSVKVSRMRGDYGGFPMPYFMNPAGYGFLLDNPWPHVYFDLGNASPDKWFLHTPGGNLDFYVLAGDTPAEIARKYCVLTGFPTLPPKWLLGFWLSWVLEVTSQDEIIKIIERMRREEIPLDVLVLDLYWRDGLVTLGLEGGDGKNIEWGRHFGDVPKFIKKIGELNLHLSAHLNTRMWSGQILEEGLKKGYIRSVAEQQNVEEVTNPQAIEWIWNYYQKRVDDGIDAWWTDNSERVDGTLCNVNLPSRNLFGHLWNKMLYDGMVKSGRQGALVLSRGGWMGSQRHTLAWPGDTGPGTERLREDLRWTLNCSISGIPFSTVDFGGFVCYDANDPSYDPANPDHQYTQSLVRTDDNVIRRIANGMLLFPVPRVHGGGAVRVPWTYPKPVSDLYKYYLELRYRLFPYIYSLSVHASKTGEPLFRPLFWHNMDDVETYGIDDQLYLGPWILLAPVVEEGSQERELYLPQGEWLHLHSDRIYTGPRKRMHVNAPLYEHASLPMFIRRGAIIPVRQPCCFNHEKPETSYTIHILPDASGEFCIYENADTSGKISYEKKGGGINVEIYNPSSIPREYIIVIHDNCSYGNLIKDQKIVYPFQSGFVASEIISAMTKSCIKFTSI